ncbi:putative membrane-associated Zn-dependent protease [Desulfosporosinus orientis DSM 765]|uniref:Zinc metalloprotease n=1 Tax=Desulfosporosinus orientis (strain ATCC 19365 / DSM 765 / NCIMB 8382 / VKM B-1628 / Singapore I) TaxID=768706 RepID=G7WE67_DESOD|nr:RIP metalloprotease RseP [Desulfosporosinus orientis]AET70043.1 putative membrane-associated Zn-dependent protease [Desulfosporosinus orientis DSM 765]
MLTTLAIVFVFGSMVMIHEFGHYIVAKWIGVKVIEFSFGFGPKILGYQGKETLYAWRLIPLGGFVKLYGMDAEADEQGNAVIASKTDPRSFLNKPVWQRMAAIAAGPIMNFVLAIIMFVSVFAYLGIPTQSNVVGSLVKGKPAAISGIEPGDRIIAVNKELTPDWARLTEVIHSKPNQILSLTIERANDKQRQTISIKTEKDAQTGNGMIGIAPVEEVIYVHASILEATRVGIQRSVDFTKLIVVSLVQMITGKIPADVGGPIMIAQVIGEGAKEGFSNLLGLTGVLSIQLGLINLFPIPALDGSRLVFLLIEGLRGKPLNPEKENMIHLVGFVLLMGLMLAVTYKDIVRLFVKAG